MYILKEYLKSCDRLTEQYSTTSTRQGTLDQALRYSVIQHIQRNSSVDVSMKAYYEAEEFVKEFAVGIEYSEVFLLAVIKEEYHTYTYILYSTKE